MNRQQLKNLLNNTIGEDSFFKQDEEYILDYAEAVQKAVTIEALDVVQQALEIAKKHMLLNHQAG